MNEQEILLSHPHDFFNLRHITVIPNTCFDLMPIGEKFTIVYETIEGSWVTPIPTPIPDSIGQVKINLVL